MLYWDGKFDNLIQKIAWKSWKQLLAKPSKVRQIWCNRNRWRKGTALGFHKPAKAQAAFLEKQRVQKVDILSEPQISQGILNFSQRSLNSSDTP